MVAEYKALVSTVLAKAEIPTQYGRPEENGRKRTYIEINNPRISRPIAEVEIASVLSAENWTSSILSVVNTRIKLAQLHAKLGTMRDASSRSEATLV